MDNEDPAVESPKIEIKIKPIRRKPAKSKLPGKVDKEYPSNLLIIFTSSEVIESLKTFAATDTNYELGGVLIGRVGKASRRLFVEIQNFIPADKGISRRASFEFTNEAQEQIHRVIESDFKDLQIVGWFHTHPGYGIFLSSADQFIDENYFNEKHHIAVVIDPTRPGVEVGAFVWNRQQQRVRVPLFEL